MEETTGKRIIEAENHVGGLFLALISDISYCSMYTHLSIERINHFFARGLKESNKRGSLVQPELVFLEDYIKIWQSTLRFYEKVTNTPKSNELSQMATSCLRILAEILAELLKGETNQKATQPFDDSIMELVHHVPQSFRSILEKISLVNPEFLAKSFFSLRTNRLIGVCVDETLTGPVLDGGRIRIFYAPTSLVPEKVNKKTSEKLVFLDDFRKYNQQVCGIS